MDAEADIHDRLKVVPGGSAFATVLAQPKSATSTQQEKLENEKNKEHLPKYTKREVKWPALLFQIHLHVGALYGLYLAFRDAYLSTTLIAIVIGAVSILGITAGAHRLWAHRTYQANWPLRLFLVVCQTALGIGSIYDWVLDHRLHHKHHGTDDDPYNYKRGLYYSHLMSKFEAPDSKRRELEKQVDMSDLEQDPIVMYQKRFYWLLMPIFCILLPLNAPIEYWNENIFNSIFIVGCLRCCLTLHLSWLVNSAVTVWGLDPQNKAAADSNLVFLVTRSYWPLYHYMVPWDYNSGEYGNYNAGFATAMIRVWAALGWVYGLRTIDGEGVKCALRTTLDTGKDIKDCLKEHEKITNDYVKNVD